MNDYNINRNPEVKKRSHGMSVGWTSKIKPVKIGLPDSNIVHLTPPYARPVGVTRGMAIGEYLERAEREYDEQLNNGGFMDVRDGNNGTSPTFHHIFIASQTLSYFLKDSYEGKPMTNDTRRHIDYFIREYFEQYFPEIKWNYQWQEETPRKLMIQLLYQSLVVPIYLSFG